MESYVKVSILIWLVAVMPGCSKFYLEDIILDGLANLNYECYDGSSEYYFRGNFAEYSICVYDGENGYSANFGYANGYVTLSPTFTLGELQAQESMSCIDLGLQKEYEFNGFLEEIRIATQPQKFGTPLDSMVKTFLVPGLFPVRGVVSADSVSTEGFEFVMNKWHHNPDIEPSTRNITMTSAMGVQPETSYVRIHEVVLEKQDEYITGFVRLEVNCRMYLRNSGEMDGYFVGDFFGEFRLPVYYKP